MEHLVTRRPCPQRKERGGLPEAVADRGLRLDAQPPQEIGDDRSVGDLSHEEGARVRLEWLAFFCIPDDIAEELTS